MPILCALLALLVANLFITITSLYDLTIKDSAGHLPQDLALKMFDKQIRSILDYACEVCYIEKQDYDIEKVHLGYLKFLPNIKPSSCTPSVYAGCGRFPLAIKHKIQVLKY